jgi:hypothetical protein
MEHQGNEDSPSRTKALLRIVCDWLFLAEMSALLDNKLDWIGIDAKQARALFVVPLSRNRIGYKTQNHLLCAVGDLLRLPRLLLR